MASATAHIKHAFPAICFKVKNTFIDDAEPLDWNRSERPEQPSVLRCVTEPVPRNKSLDFELDDDGVASTATCASAWDETPNTPTQEAMPPWPRTMSGDDLLSFFSSMDIEGLEMETTGDESLKLSGIAAPMQSTAPGWPRTKSGDDLAEFLALVGESPSSDDCWTPVVTESGGNSIAAESVRGVQSELALMVEQALMEQCEFPATKVTSCTLMPLVARSAKTKRTAPSNVTRCLRICVAGLPAMKRGKWTQPLSLKVAGVLERMECQTMVRRGELFASLGSMAGGEMVFVDLCAPRKSD